MLSQLQNCSQNSLYILPVFWSHPVIRTLTSITIKPLPLMNVGLEIPIMMLFDAKNNLLKQRENSLVKKKINAVIKMLQYVLLILTICLDSFA